ncbi:MAG TPA: M20 family metallopeptidase [Mycobacteriales bacterium]|nr:M20 family metallopeptidase [Mycobacteriales bacterium]
MSNDPLAGVLDDARALLPEAVELRRRIHRRPEIGLRLPRTQETVLAAIDDLGLKVSTGREVDSVVAILEGDRPGGTVLLRGDMDGLPLQEDSGEEFAAETPGAMHACGHDTHVAMLAGAARLLAGRRSGIAGRVVLMFQPGEEGYHGARYMLDEGLLDAAGTPVDAAYALHITTEHPSGTLHVRPGPLMASSDVLDVTVRGAGAHASSPQDGVDPITIACEIVTAMQSYVTRRLDIFDPAVVTIAQITAGTTNNIIPETARLYGTIRTLSADTRQAVKAGLTRLAEGIAAAHGATAEVEIGSGYPPTVNDAGAAETVLATASELIGPDAVSVLRNPVMGAEDWSYVLQRVPGAMAFLGGCPPELDPATAPGNHSNKVRFHEDAMAVGIATYAGLALHHLGR